MSSTKTTKPMKKSTKTKQATIPEVQQAGAQAVEEHVEMKEAEDVADATQKKTVKKTGRTLLLSPNMGSTINESLFKGLSGLGQTHSTKNGCYFLTFDTVENAQTSFTQFHESHPELRVKFARYQIFFTITGLTETSDYSVVKQELSSMVEKNTDGNVLYFKLYRKGDKYIGCGDLTVDTKDSMDKLLNKDSPFKTFTLGELTGTFYRFNKTQTDQSTYAPAQ
jgi:hypothetical protein